MSKNGNKRYKLLIALILMLIIVLDIVVVMTVCRKSNTDNKNEANSSESVSVMDRNLKLIATMNANISSEDYRKILGLGDELNELVVEISEMDYSNPVAVYELSNVDDIVNFMMYTANVNENLDAGMKKYISNKVCVGLANIIVANKSGTQALAVGSSTGYGEVFIDSNIDSVKSYIYIYEKAYPVFITYVPQNDGIVSVSACYLIIDDMINASEETMNDISIGLVNLKYEKIQ